MSKTIKWQFGNLDIHQWGWGEGGEVGRGQLNDLLCKILNDRIDTLFCDDGLQPSIDTTFGACGDPIIRILIAPPDGDAVLQADRSFEDVVGDFVNYAHQYSDDDSAKLKNILINALAQLTVKETEWRELKDKQTK
jgi:hypothetical protein